MRRKYTPSFIAKVSFEVIEDSSSVITIVPFRRKATGGSSLCRTTRFKGYEDMDKSIKKAPRRDCDVIFQKTDSIINLIFILVLITFYVKEKS